MAKQNQLAIGALVILLAMAVVYFTLNRDNAGGPDQIDDQPEPVQLGGEEPKDEDQSRVNQLTGLLRVSNDPARGNLMLELSDSDHIIYMTSSRDFSDFYGEEVVVTIAGDLNVFTLIDIHPR